MRRLRLAAALLASVLLVAGSSRADPRVHVVSEGESLSVIAARYRVSVADLRRWNELDGDRLLVGQRLLIGRTRIYRVVPGDTLSCIAERHGLSLEQLRDANPGVRGTRVEVGQRLRIVGGVSLLEGTPAPRTYRVRRGDMLGRIARRHGVTLPALRAANPDLGPVLQVGVTLTLPGTVGSESIGAPYCGALRGGVAVGRHPAYVLRNPRRAWGTARTVELLRAGFDAYRRAHPRGPRARVHDLSLPQGGPIDDHRSHQSGRDVDVTYLQRRGCGPGGCPLRTVTPGLLDARRQWTLLRAWLRSGDVEAIYIDYRLQAPLRREARRRGATSRQLERWFQHPRGRWHAEGIVRHFPHHADHLHIRFACARTDTRCR